MRRVQASIAPLPEDKQIQLPAEIAQWIASCTGLPLLASSLRRAVTADDAAAVIAS